MVDNVKETNHDGEKPEEETGKENKYLLPDKAYKALKWVALIALPAVAWLAESYLMPLVKGTFSTAPRLIQETLHG